MKSIKMAAMAAIICVTGLDSPGQAARGTPTVTFSLAENDGTPRATAFIAETPSRTRPEISLKEVIATSLFLSADREAARSGLHVYFLRIDSGRVVAVQMQSMSAHMLASMERRPPAIPPNVVLPGDTFLPGDMFSSRPRPADTRPGFPTGALRGQSKLILPEPRNQREVALFDWRARLAKDGSGLLIGVFPIAGESAGTGGGVFIPADGVVRK